ncbi:autotransporter outer membrane beta-barrel domain-containing protein [Klebsiella variicola]|uniref:autotransporter outer membrane beta-barrel domain-containing protein n=1 Tax=Klebsiella variicola TaxID=244366 RepID=UPI000671F798|nr:autotransporter outer membrane beta-barrel domain-containing protein [Klebsiella variicola]HCB0356291.1 autotransporter outer membrane beta-barrel domain-containing protein [Klebsiella variicola subsp. variicola]EIY5102150.1 autotransporter outer membrane beta-barrel domain-containing protein [Klebsiella variicola]EIY5158231.1 autotransporter outer membrane beta-barrel domain-containing protein [Klebsiella variicola]EKW2093081.1 autotransporter outer membrane beta-barrel domain-containing pr
MKLNALANSVRLAVIYTPVIITGLITSAHADDPCNSADSMTYVCSGRGTSGIDLAGSSLNVSTAPGFGIDTTEANAIKLTNSGGELILKDENQSQIIGGDNGITAINDNSATNMMVTSTGHVNGGSNAVSIQNSGSGATVITTTGTINSGNVGINAVNGSHTTGLTIITDSEFGVGKDAINATNNGTGATAITTTGTINSGNVGINTVNGSHTTGLTISTDSTFGVGVDAINATNNGTGGSIVSTSGNISSGRHGIYANNDTTATDITINSSSNIGVGGDGINTTNNGTGMTEITISGTVSGEHGIYAVNGGNATDMTIDVSGDVSSWATGIYAENNGAGKTSIINTGEIGAPSYGNAITTKGRSNTITNAGRIIGKVQLGNEGNTFTNANAGTWDMSGDMSDFGTGSNSLVNSGILITANGSFSDGVQTTTLSNVGTLTNSGSLTMANERAGDTTVIDGNYIGKGGTLTFDTVLGDDNAVTDKLIINGNTSGISSVLVNNIGGNGAQTLNGIEIISVNGESDGVFTQDGRIAAGAYDYSLVRGKGINSNNWYLSSWQDQGDTAQVLRPESGAYATNLALSNNLFTTRLHDLIGKTQYTDVMTGEKSATSMWVRNEGGHNRSRDSSGQLKTQANRYVLQIGGDIAQWSSNGDDLYHLGLMAGYANSKSKTVSSINGYRADGSVNGYSTGVYGTWNANNVDKTGAYLGTWVQYNWFKNRVSGEGINSEAYDSQGFTASAESGYTFRVGQTADGLQSYFIKPEAMLTWMGVKADKHRELNGTEVVGEGDGNVQTRLGAKTYINNNRKIDDSKESHFQPFAEVNWIHNTRNFASRMDGVVVKQDGTKNIAELKVGAEVQLNKQFGLWGNVAQELGDKGYSDTSATLGGKYSF